MTLFKKLIPDSQVFQQDPEGWNRESRTDARTRLLALVTKHRASRGLAMADVAQQAANKPSKPRKPTKKKAALPSPDPILPDPPPQSKEEGLLDLPPFE